MKAKWRAVGEGENVSIVDGDFILDKNYLPFDTNTKHHRVRAAIRGTLSASCGDRTSD